MPSPLPLFVADLDTLRERLRLSGVRPEGQWLIDEAIEKVRGGFVRRLGVARVVELAAIPYALNTLDASSILRTIANTTEGSWVRMELLRSMPVIVGDGTGSAQAVWNDEGVWQQMSEESRAAEIHRLAMEIEEALGVLSGSEELGSETTIHATSIGPDSRTPIPGSSARVWVS